MKHEMLTPEQYRARGAFLRFQSALASLEMELNSIRSEMSIECQFELETMSRIARSFFRMANEGIFSRQKASVTHGK